MHHESILCRLILLKSLTAENMIKMNILHNTVNIMIDYILHTQCTMQIPYQAMFSEHCVSDDALHIFMLSAPIANIVCP